MTKLPVEGQTVTCDYLRSITNDDAEAELRHPLLWGYILRDPTGAICSHGHGKTRKECEQKAIGHATECADEAWPDSRMWLPARWRFAIWPPTNVAQELCCRDQRPNATKKRSSSTLSKTQIDVLLFCTNYRLSRYWMGWACDDRLVGPHPGRMYKEATINSLWERGLLEANFTDPRLPCSELGGMRKLDGAPKFQVWTSALGGVLLQEKELLTNEDKLVYH